jgi:hypothetical protein
VFGGVRERKIFIYYFLKKIFIYMDFMFIYTYYKKGKIYLFIYFRGPKAQKKLQQKKKIGEKQPMIP